MNKDYHLRAYRLLRQFQLDACMDLCSQYPDDHIMTLFHMRAQTNLRYDPDYLITASHDLDIVDTSLQTSITSSTAAPVKPKTRALNSTTRQALTSRLATAAARKTATRMKTAALRRNENQVDPQVLSQFPHIAFDYLVAMNEYRQALTIASSRSSEQWWRLQAIKCMYLMGDYKRCYDMLLSQDLQQLATTNYDYMELLMCTSTKLGLALPLADTSPIMDSMDLLVMRSKLDRDAGVAVYERILTFDNSNMHALLGLASRHLETSPELSLLLYMRAFRLAGGEGREIAANVALAAFKIDSLDLVGGPLHVALSNLDDTPTGVWLVLAYIFVFMGMFELADKCYALADHGGGTSVASTLSNWALVRERMGDMTGAWNLYVRALEMSANDGTLETDRDMILENAFENARSLGPKRCLLLLQYAESSKHLYKFKQEL
eukprot:Partr_v1_DN27246_c0_g1_i2_m38941